VTHDAVAVPAPRRWRSRLPLILLILSLALNAFFIGGAFWLKSQAARMQMSPAERAQQVARRLSLDDDQRAAFERFIHTARQYTREMREANMPLVEQAWKEFAKSNPDEALIDRLFSQAADNRRHFQIELGQALRGFLATLSEEQRRNFIDLLHNRQHRDAPSLLRQLTH
jgi:uncharacterized membrane protein